ncbi:MAG: hypothetical protein ACSHWU_12290 [Marinicella sp.]
MKKIILSGMVFFTLQANAFVTLGTDSACHYDSDNYSIQDVIDLGVSDEIRVTTQQTFYENIDVRETLKLYGGYTNCSNANANTASSKTVIDGGGLNSVFDINQFDTSGYVTISRFSVKNGAALGSNSGGGFSIRDQNEVGISVQIRSSLISLNNGSWGGGLSINGATLQVSLYDTVVINNEATTNGGGIYCNESNLNLYYDTGVILNTVYNTSPSYGNGGGIYAANDCLVQINSGTTGSLFDFKGVAGNTATNNGGGIYASFGARIILNGNNIDEVVNVNGNAADSDNNGSGIGGGIYLNGADTVGELYGALIKGNQAQHGGGISATNGAQLFVGKLNGNCWNQKKCNEISENMTSTSGGYGGAVYMLNAYADIKDSHFSKNRADNGTVMYADNGTIALIRASYLYDNGDGGNDGWSDIFNLRFYNSGLTLNHVTIANNKATGASIRNNAGSYNFMNSIIHESIMSLNADITNAVGEEACLVLNDDNGFDHLTNSLVANPYFIDENNHDYRLSRISHAIDMCGDNGITLPTDNDGEPMWDDPNVNNALGIRDAGADETFLGDVIYKSTFE